MYNNKNKFALWISPDVRELVDANYKADCCRSRSDYIEKAIRFYTGYLHAEKAADYLPRVLSSILERCLTRFADRMGRLLFKQSVESNVVCHLLAEDVDMSYEEYEHLRNECIREVKQCHGELNFMDKYRVLVKDARTFKRRMKCEPGFLSELSGLFTSTRPAGSPAPNRMHERIDSAEFEKYLLLRWADLPDALPTLQAARLISVRPQRLYEQVRAGVLHSVTIGGKQYCAKMEIIACAASPERLAQPRGEAYMALIEDYLNGKI